MKEVFYMARILIVEDEASIRELIKMTLSMEAHITEEADNGELAFDMIQKKEYDLILLDIMLPKMDGYQLLSKIKDKEIPVIFLTAKISLQDRVFGLKLGADDYIIKPFEPMELLARIESVLRRCRKQGDREERGDIDILYRNIRINERARSVTKDGVEIALTTKEFELFLMLVKNQNMVFSREQLLDQVWGYDYFGGTRTVDMHIKQLRQKLDLKEGLETVFKVGYKLRA